MRSKPKILLLTNPFNEDPQEDIFLYQRLKKSFDVQSCHPLDTLPFEQRNRLFLIRNIWPTHVYQKEFEKAARRWKRKKIVTYNSLDGRADRLGKQYLIELFKKDFPVVSTYTIPEAKRRLTAGKYMTKPLFGTDGSGVIIVKNLKDFKPVSSSIVQPMIDFKEELAFYFLDNQFQYALRFKHKLKSHNCKIYSPTKKELTVIRPFVDWNAMSYGIQRVDALRLHDDNLLVNEIEDFCPYLYLEDLPHSLRQRFMSNLITSIKRLT